MWPALRYDLWIMDVASVEYIPIRNINENLFNPLISILYTSL